MTVGLHNTLLKSRLLHCACASPIDPDMRTAVHYVLHPKIRGCTTAVHYVLHPRIRGCTLRN